MLIPEIMYDNTPDTNLQRQTTAATGGPISATVFHNGSVSSSSGVNYYFPVTNSQTSQRSPVPFNVNHLNMSSKRNSPLKSHEVLFDWNNLLNSLDLFYKERLIKLNHAVVTLKATAQDDEIIQTMLENKETLAFADQRLLEIIKEGISIEQEMTIENLQQQLFLS